MYVCTFCCCFLLYLVKFRLIFVFVFVFLVNRIFSFVCGLYASYVCWFDENNISLWCFLLRFSTFLYFALQRAQITQWQMAIFVPRMFGWNWMRCVTEMVKKWRYLQKWALLFPLKINHEFDILVYALTDKCTLTLEIRNNSSRELVHQMQTPVFNCCLLFHWIRFVFVRRFYFFSG